MTGKAKLVSIISTGVILASSYYIYDCVDSLKQEVVNQKLEVIKQTELIQQKDSEIEALHEEIDSLGESLRECREELNDVKYNQSVNVIPLSTQETHRVKVTAYSYGDSCDTGIIMANGEYVREGCVAYNGVPFGTIIIIDGVSYTVTDRVGADGVVDIYMNSIVACKEFGVQYKDVTIIRPKTV